jgi:hypothetical protein
VTEKISCNNRPNNISFSVDNPLALLCYKSINTTSFLFTLADSAARFEGWGETQEKGIGTMGKVRSRIDSFGHVLNKQALLWARQVQTRLGNIGHLLSQSPPYQLAKVDAYRNTKFRGNNGNRLGFVRSLLIAQEIKKSEKIAKRVADASWMGTSQYYLNLWRDLHKQQAQTRHLSPALITFIL